MTMKYIYTGEGIRGETENYIREIKCYERYVNNDKENSLAANYTYGAVYACVCRDTRGREWRI